jgi:RNA polymerase sigma factor (sigma-70 family)
MPRSLRTSGKRPRDDLSKLRRSVQEILPEELLRRCKANDEWAWEEFVRRYADLVYTTIQAKVGLSAGELEDAFQETFLSIYQNLTKLRDTSKLVAWIVRIAYFQGVNRIRKRDRIREVSIEHLPEEEIPDNVAGRFEPPEDLVIRLRRAQRAKALMELLPKRCRGLLYELFYRDPVPSYDEIALRLGIPVGSIGPTRARCLSRMRRLWEERGVED